MAWGNIAGNKMVTFADLQSSGINLNGGQSHSSSNQLMTKTDITTKYNVNTGNLSGYASNQLVNRSAIVSGVTTYIQTVRGAYPSSARAFGASDATFNLYSTTGTIGVGDILYTDGSLTNQYIPSDVNSRWYKNNQNNTSFRMSLVGVVEYVQNDTSTLYGSVMVSVNFENPFYETQTAEGNYSYLVEYNDGTGWHTIISGSNPNITGLSIESNYDFCLDVPIDGTIRVTYSCQLNYGASQEVSLYVPEYSDYYNSFFVEFPDINTVEYWDLSELIADTDPETEISVWVGFVMNTTPAGAYFE